jgi:dynein intermediate chain 2
VQRYTKKLNRDPTLGFASATRDLTRTAERCIKQNNEIDLFEEYFASEKAEHMSEEISTKTLMIFKDPNQIKRAVTKIAWQVEGGTEHRVAVAYAQLRFQQEPPGMPKNSYIWNINDPNRPEVTLEPTSPLCCMQWHHKIQDVLAGGSYNGSVSCFDLRAGSVKGVIKPVQTSVLEKSHHDPVYDVTWATQSRQGNDFFSVSTDGRVLWWDMRSLDAPTDQLILRDANNPEGKIYGGTCLHYNQDAHPHKFLVGSEQGFALNCQNRNKKAECIWRFGDEQGKHHGPIYAMQRNPIHLKYFLTVGDWSAKIWSEELKIPIMQTRYHNSYLTDGCWSQTRAGLFFLTRMDGFLDVWDFFYRQNEVAYSQKISDAVLTSIYVQQSMCAIGDAEGTTSILSLCPALYDQTLQPKEREIMLTIFDREFRREKTLDVAKRLADKKPAKAKAEKNNKAEKLQGQLEQIEENFFGMVAADEEEREQIKARGDANQEAINAAAD